MARGVTALSAKNHLVFWTGAFALFLAFVWLFGDILLPFVLGMAIAYLLNPLVEFLGRHKVPRWIAALIILGLFFVFVITVLALAIPPLYREAAALADAMPGYIEKLPDLIMPYTGWLQDKLGNGHIDSLREALQNNIGKALSVGVGVLGGLASGGQAFAGFISILILTPITAYFMMKDWAAMTGWVDNLLPRGSRDTIRDLLHKIDRKLSGFVRGQLSVAFALGTVYALALTIAGLRFGFLIGLTAGILSIIPLVGSTTGLLASVIVAWLQSGEWGYTAIIAAIFFTGQFIEGHILTPKLLGKSVGLHPLWILFALLAGGSLFGIVGMLLAVPVTASIGVLIGFALSQYKDSPYYKDGAAKTKSKKSPAAKKA